MRSVEYSIEPSPHWGSVVRLQKPHMQRTTAVFFNVRESLTEYCWIIYVFIAILCHLNTKTCFFVYGVIYCLMGGQVNQLMQWQTDFYEGMWGEKGRYGGLLCRGCTTVLHLLLYVEVYHFELKWPLGIKPVWTHRVILHLNIIKVFPLFIYF